VLGADRIPNLIERCQSNKRKKIYFFYEGIRTQVASYFFEFEDYFNMDSMALKICKFNVLTGSKSTKMCLKLIHQ
jgi:hypothetical protein